LHRLRAVRRSGWASHSGCSLPGAFGVTIGHHDDHWFAFSFGEQVVEDNVGTPLANPSRLILAGAMLQIEHGKALFGLRFVTGWQINQRVTPTTCHFRVI